ncbi:triacylglycerol lipase LipY [Mycobacterium camsae]|uniref:triacylglycerol lipase LipY n=1 Tax=Mycobacterium gordonae TaxID=1778 RepID=UPI00197D2869|nr:alpha/beta hydrolase fold domain-containing protein [Mycobacterium gordonae]
MTAMLAIQETFFVAAQNIASIGSAVAGANEGVVNAIVEVGPASEDEVSAAVAALFSAHGQSYRDASAAVASFHDRFVQTLNDAHTAYAAAEVENFALLDKVDFVFSNVRQTSSAVAGEIDRLGTMLVTEIVGAPAAPPFQAIQDGTFTGTPALPTRLELASLYPVKPLLDLSGMETRLIAPGSPFLTLLASDVPPLSWVIGNSPPPLLNLLLNQTVQQTTSHGITVVQITPAHPTGEYVIGIHGGAFVLPPSFLHWIHYSVMSYQTGAIVQVPIYPLLQEGGTAALVVPAMAGFISEQIGLHGAANVSVIGDSSGGNIALAAVQYMVGHGEPAPSSMVLLSPWLDAGMTNPNIAFVQDPIVPIRSPQLLGQWWAGNLPVNDPLVSPLYGPMNGLPQTYVYSGNLDSLAPDVFRLQDAARAANAPVDFVLANGQIHDWIILTIDGPRYWQQINQELGIVR